MGSTHLFSPFTVRGITFKNRIGVSPMCQYSSENGFSNDWHFVHLGSRAVGGAALVFTEATAVTPEGRISPEDLGIWSDHHIDGLLRITEFIQTHGAIPGMQIAHAGRKASITSPWQGNTSIAPEKGGWQIVGPSPIPFNEKYQTPHALTTIEIQNLILAFANAAKRALAAKFQVLEIHSAHGYLLHEFLSPLSNQRNDNYGGTFENRIRLLIEVIDAVRQVWPEQYPLFVRISASEWVENGWNIDESVELARRLKSRSVDLVDCSSGGNIDSSIPTGSGYQTAFAQRIKQDSQIATSAVGLITSPQQADHIIRTSQADMVFLAREMLRNPYWPLSAATQLKQKISWPNQYARAAP